jgi:uncharacterized protein
MIKHSAVIALFILVLIVSAKTCNAINDQDERMLKLLAVSDNGKGATANLFLRTDPGTGTVFLQAGPVTKIDTRISIRLAKEIACQTISSATEKCNINDFFYRIEANASIIGGPSAGAATAALAIATLDGLTINRSVAITGTINSGGLVGGVGGLKEKIDAASVSGISQVLIPAGEGKTIDQETNKTIDLVSHGKSIGITVTEVHTIEEVLYYLTGKNYSEKDFDLEIDGNYSLVMAGLSGMLCNRSINLSTKLTNQTVRNALKAGFYQANLTTEAITGLLDEARIQQKDGFEELSHGNHYSAASMCFSAGVRYSYLQLLSENMSRQEAIKILNSVESDAEKFSLAIPDANTIAEMQVRGTVNERIDESQKLIAQSREELGNGNYADGIYNLAFATERLGSAKAWANFLKSEYTNKTGQLSSDSQTMKNGCITMIQESDERMQYLDIYLPGILKSKDELGPAYDYLQKADYSSCIYKASIARAKVNAMLSAIGGTENISTLVNDKLAAARKSIARQTSKGDFPIIGYSYYEYASALEQTDPSSALLYSEYSRELSNLDIYLKPTQPTIIVEEQKPNNRNSQLIFLTGLAVGMGISGIIAAVIIILVKPKNRRVIMAKRH